MLSFSALVALLLPALPVPAQPQPTAYFSFEKDMDGVAGAKTVTATVGGKPELVPGKAGQGLKVGPTFGYLDCPTTGVLRRTAGTVEMWVQAQDWQADDPKFHVFFEARGQGALYLYKFWTSDKLLMLTAPAVEGPYTSSQALTTFAPGKWHHIAGTWSPAGVQAYFDGKPAQALPLPGQLPVALGETFRLGDGQWQFDRTTSSIVDEVRIYDRALSPAHIAAHAAGNLDFTVPLKAETSSLDYEIDPDAGTADVRFETGAADVEDERLQVRVAVLQSGAGVPADVAAHPVMAGEASVSLPVPIRQPGKYEIGAEVLLDGEPTLTLRRELIVPTTEWLGNQIGLEDKVLPPWTPVEAEGTRLRCWGREYSFAEAVLPTQITAAGAPLLAEPVTLRVTTAEGTKALSSQVARLLDATPTTAHLQGQATVEVGGKRVPFRTDVTFEYDGLLLVAIACDRPQDLSVEGLTIDIPVRAEHALYLHRYVPSWIPTSWAMPKGEGVIDKSAFIPYVWFGDNDRGLFWFCESDEMWPNGQAENAIEVLRQGDRVILRLNVLASRQKLPEDWRLVFGLQATPVKPIAKDWRKWRMTGALAGDQVRARQNIQIVWPQANAKDSLAAFGWPEAADEQAFAAHISGLHEQGLLAVPYLCLTWVTDDTPEWRFFKRDWEGEACDPSIPEAGWKHQFALVSPVGKGYSDFIIWKTKQFMVKYHIDGVYHDQTHPYTSSNTRAGWGCKREGVEHISYPILGYRALYRRNYAMVKSLPWPTFTQAHMSGKVVVPVLAYDDSYLDGEHFRGVVKASYMDVSTLEAFRAEYMGRQWGLAPYFLPEFDAEHAQQMEPTRGLMALLMVHDINVWPIWCNAKVIDDAFAALDEFGYVDAEFIPYFDPEPPASTDLADIHASAYRRVDGTVLLVVANVGKEDREGDVRIDLQRLGLADAKAISWPDRAELAMTDGLLKLAVPRLGYRMVRLAE